MMKKIILIILTIALITGCYYEYSAETVSYALGEKEFPGYYLLSRPSQTEMTIQVIPDQETSVVIEYGKEDEAMNRVTKAQTGSKDAPISVVLNELEVGASYTYRIRFKENDSQDWYVSESSDFQLPRQAGQPFKFVIQSDSHLSNKADRPVYNDVMNQIADFEPDLFMDLGDTFLNDQDGNKNLEQVDAIYYEQLPYLNTVAKSAPLYLVIGNHEGEYGFLNDGTANNLPTYSALSRKKYYPNPLPNDFYTGNEEVEPFIGQPENYYAFQWGDALFVALDPYRYTTIMHSESKKGWDWTLGDAQYEWLTTTLEESDAKYKFVFAHHAIGNIRGGDMISDLYEWGGRNKRGIWLFDTYRPTWEKPIHQLMVDEGVTAFFQGHDHIFSREEVDGIIYQTLPKPAEVIPDQQNNFDSFPNGDVMANSGYLEVYVESDYVQVDYIRSVVAGDETNQATGKVYSYRIHKVKEVEVLVHHDDTEIIENYLKLSPNIRRPAPKK